MFSHKELSKDNQARYIRNTHQSEGDYFNPHQLDQYDLLVPPMKKALKFTAKATWFMMKNLVKAAFHLPGLVRKTARMLEHTPEKTQRRKNPSPETAFPAP